MDVDSKDLAREALDGLFRRRAEAGKFYCAPCLVERLKRTFPLGAVQAALAATFEHPWRAAREARLAVRGLQEAATLHRNPVAGSG
jgi:hypothetical protein